MSQVAGSETLRGQTSFAAKCLQRDCDRNYTGKFTEIQKQWHKNLLIAEYLPLYTVVCMHVKRKNDHIWVWDLWETKQKPHMFSCIRAGLSELRPQGLWSSRLFCPSRPKPRQDGTQAKEFSAWKVSKPEWIAAPLTAGFLYLCVRHLLGCALGSESESAQGWCSGSDLCSTARTRQILRKQEA